MGPQWPSLHDKEVVTLSVPAGTMPALVAKERIDDRYALMQFSACYVA